jgi:hypothetical protein
MKFLAPPPGRQMPRTATPRGALWFDNRAAGGYGNCVTLERQYFSALKNLQLWSHYGISNNGVSPIIPAGW